MLSALLSSQVSTNAPEILVQRGIIMEWPLLYFVFLPAFLTSLQFRWCVRHFCRLYSTITYLHRVELSKPPSPCCWSHTGCTSVQAASTCCPTELWQQIPSLWLPRGPWCLLHLRHWSGEKLLALHAFCSFSGATKEEGIRTGELTSETFCSILYREHRCSKGQSRGKIKYKFLPWVSTASSLLSLLPFFFPSSQPFSLPPSHPCLLFLSLPSFFSSFLLLFISFIAL